MEQARISLAVQWLGLCTFTAEGPGSTPAWGTKILQAAWTGQKKKKKKKPTTLVRTYCISQGTLLNTLMAYIAKQSKNEWIHVWA